METLSLETRPHTAILVGASGLVGSQVLERLTADPLVQRIVLPVRQKLILNNPKIYQYIVQFDKPESYRDLLKGDVIYLCLGTTRSKTKKDEDYIRIEFTYTLELAQTALANGAQTAVYVSSNGADVKSRLFYTRLKGQVEASLAELNFPSLYCVRPSLLLGERDEFRFGEWFFSLFTPFCVGPLAKIKPIHASLVGQAMVRWGKESELGTHIKESWEIRQKALQPLLAPPHQPII